MEHLNSFVITLATVIIFISAVELIMPDNSFKKYQSFVLGLIVLAVILTPIIKFFDSTETLGDKVKATIEEMEENNEKNPIYSSDKNNQYVFATLENNCEATLREKYDEKEFDVKVEGEIDFSNYETTINSVVVNIRNKDELEPIIIGEENKLEEKKTAIGKEVEEFIANELKIDEKIIMVIEK